MGIVTSRPKTHAAACWNSQYHISDDDGKHGCISESHRNNCVAYATGDFSFEYKSYNACKRPPRFAELKTRVDRVYYNTRCSGNDTNAKCLFNPVLVQSTTVPGAGLSCENIRVLHDANLEKIEQKSRHYFSNIRIVRDMCGYYAHVRGSICHDSQ